MGLPFDTKQSDGEVKFWFGGADEPAEVLKITAVQDGSMFKYSPCISILQENCALFRFFIRDHCIKVHVFNTVEYI